MLRFRRHTRRQAHSAAASFDYFTQLQLRNEMILSIRLRLFAPYDWFVQFVLVWVVFLCRCTGQQWQVTVIVRVVATSDGVVVVDDYNDLESCSLRLGRVGRRQVGGLQLAAICREVSQLKMPRVFVFSLGYTDNAIILMCLTKKTERHLIDDRTFQNG